VLSEIEKIFGLIHYILKKMEKIRNEDELRLMELQTEDLKLFIFILS